MELRRGPDWIELPLRASPGASADGFAGLVEGVPRLRICAKRARSAFGGGQRRLKLPDALEIALLVARKMRSWPSLPCPP